MLFKDLNIINPIQKALTAQGYTQATPIQEKAIPNLLEGTDLLGCAQTGTGKTAAFAIPILQSIALEQKSPKDKRKIKALILAPTRELAVQINDCFHAYAMNLKLRTLAIYGGVSQVPQTKKLKYGIDILVATPGRLLDLINQGFVDLKHVKHFVLDEADLMLDMGMLQDVKRIITHLPEERQTMFFSATMPAEISKLADNILTKPIKIKITPEFSPIDIIDQKVYFVDKSNKTNLLIHLLKENEFDSVIVFTRTKHGADKVVKELNRQGLASVAIHGNKSQNQRQTALNDFKKRKVKILVATDIAARGLDIKELSHVINYNLPESPETYVHRIGRTGRAGLGGIAISFCCSEEKPLLRSIQKLINKKLPKVNDHPFPLTNTSENSKNKQNQRSNNSRYKKSRTSKTDKAYKSDKRSNTQKSSKTAPSERNKKNKSYGKNYHKSKSRNGYNKSKPSNKRYK